MFFTIEGNVFEKPDEVVIRLVDCTLQDIGTGGHTQFSNAGDEVIDMYDKYPERMKCRAGLIHSHNNMSVFFSGEDVAELRQNCPGTDFYFSIIVNNAGEMIAKIAYMEESVTESVKVSYIDRGIKKFYTKDVGRKHSQMVTVDTTVYLEEDLDIDARIEELQKSGVVDGRPKYSPATGYVGSSVKDESQKSKVYTFNSLDELADKLDNQQEEREVNWWEQSDRDLVNHMMAASGQGRSTSLSRSEELAADFAKMQGKGNKGEKATFKRPDWMGKDISENQLDFSGTKVKDQDYNNMDTLLGKIVLCDPLFKNGYVAALKEVNEMPIDGEIYAMTVLKSFADVYKEVFGKKPTLQMTTGIMNQLAQMPDKYAKKVSREIRFAAKRYVKQLQNVK